MISKVVHAAHTGFTRVTEGLYKERKKKKERNQRKQKEHEMQASTKEGRGKDWYNMQSGQAMQEYQLSPAMK